MDIKWIQMDIKRHILKINMIDGYLEQWIYPSAIEHGWPGSPTNKIQRFIANNHQIWECFMALLDSWREEHIIASRWKQLEKRKKKLEMKQNMNYSGNNLFFGHEYRVQYSIGSRVRCGFGELRVMGLLKHWRTSDTPLNCSDMLTGWWLTYPSEKYESQLGYLYSQCVGK